MVQQPDQGDPSDEVGPAAIEAVQRRLEELSGTVPPETMARRCLVWGVDMESASQFELACAFYSKGISLDPRNSDLRYFLNNNLGYSLNQLGRFTDGEPYCRAAIEINAARHNAYKNLGVSLTGQKRYAEAAVPFVQAARACPADRRALHCLERLVSEVPEVLSLVPDLRSCIEECRELELKSSSPSKN